MGYRRRYGATIHLTWALTWPRTRWTSPCGPLAPLGVSTMKRRSGYAGCPVGVPATGGGERQGFADAKSGSPLDEDEESGLWIGRGGDQGLNLGGFEVFQ